jgi:hypothetical protein
MDLFCVAYTSEARPGLIAEDVDQLLASARATNVLLKVTGVLLYGAGRFFQYFEGPKEGVDEVYTRILRSRRHTNVVELEFQPIRRRRFNRWFMGFREAPASVLQGLAQQQWARELPWIEGDHADSAGMLHLLSLASPDSTEYGVLAPA